MTEELDGIFFDLGGTLVDTTVPRELIWSEVLQGRGCEVDIVAIAGALRVVDRELDERFASIQGMDEGPFWLEYNRKVLARLGLELRAEEVVQDLSESMSRMVLDDGNWKDFADVRPLLDGLGNLDIEVGLISNATELARRVLRRLELEKYFEPVIISCEVGHRKPSREIFDIALDESGVAASRAIYIGDKPAVDIVGATNAGMNAVLIDRGDLFPDKDCIRIMNLDSLRTFVQV
ncbi:MAG TPA: HAD family hydrolase [Thermoplasmata archaeon]|nr:HAD family hydrolase [Thermoplasmata archaeon]